MKTIVYSRSAYLAQWVNKCFSKRLGASLETKFGSIFFCGTQKLTS